MGKLLMSPRRYCGGHFESNEPAPDPSEVVANYRKVKIPDAPFDTII